MTERHNSDSRLGRATASAALLAASLGAPVLAVQPHGDPARTDPSATSPQAIDRSARYGSRGTETASAGQRAADALPEKYRMSTWLGKPVNDAAGHRLGTASELVMDDNGILRYVVIEREDGVRGNNELVAVPVGHVQYPSSRAVALVLDATARQMREAPAFSAGAWPDMADAEWTARAIAHWLPDPEKPTAAADADFGQGREAQPGLSDTLLLDPNRDMVYLSEPRERLFEHLDIDRDAAIEQQEARANAGVAEQFDRLDTYDNGRLTRSEFSMFEIRTPSPSSANQEQ